VNDVACDFQLNGPDELRCCCTQTP
jgi:hypothetical protein